MAAAGREHKNVCAAATSVGRALNNRGKGRPGGRGEEGALAACQGRGGRAASPQPSAPRLLRRSGPLAARTAGGAAHSNSHLLSSSPSTLHALEDLPCPPAPMCSRPRLAWPACCPCPAAATVAAARSRLEGGGSAPTAAAWRGLGRAGTAAGGRPERSAAPPPPLTVSGCRSAGFTAWPGERPAPRSPCPAPATPASWPACRRGRRRRPAGRGEEGRAGQGTGRAGRAVRLQRSEAASPAQARVGRALAYCSAWHPPALRLTASGPQAPKAWEPPTMGLAWLALSAAAAAPCCAATEAARPPAPSPLDRSLGVSGSALAACGGAGGASQYPHSFIPREGVSTHCLYCTADVRVALQRDVAGRRAGGPAAPQR